MGTTLPSSPRHHAPPPAFRIALIFMSLINVTVRLGNNAPLFSETVAAKDMKMHSFLSFYSRLIVRSFVAPPDVRLDHAAVVMREYGCGTVKVNSIIDHMQNYLVLDITEVKYVLSSTHAPVTGEALPQAAEDERSGEDEDENDDEMLVDEDGMPYQPSAKRAKPVEQDGAVDE